MGGGGGGGIQEAEEKEKEGRSSATSVKRLAFKFLERRSLNFINVNYTFSC